MFEIWPRSPWLPLLRLAIVYLALLVCMALMQRRLIYMPVRYDLDEARRRARDTQLTLWPADDDAYAAFLAEPQRIPASGTVLVFHGNASDAVARAYFADVLTRRGYRVLLVEYPGYGARNGRLSEASLVADGAATLRLARKRYGGPLLVLGESLGAGVAAGVAATVGRGQADALILITPWDSLTHVAQRRYWFLPVRGLLRDRYDSVAHARAFGGPVAVIAAQHDQIVPARHSDALFTALGAPKRHWVLSGCGHNDWPEHPDHGWWDEVLAFLRHRQNAL